MKQAIILLALVSVATILVAGCTSANDVSGIGKTAIVKPLDYGNGVYYFDANDAQFGNSLSEFIGNHKELEIVSVTGNDRCGYGITCGYFVITRKATT